MIELQKREPQAIKFKAHTDEISGLGILPKSHFVSCGDDGQLILWNKNKRGAINHFPVHQKKINSIALLNNCQTLVTGSDDCTLKVFDVSSQIDFVLKNTIRESGPVQKVCAFYGNCKFVVSCVANGVIRIWNVDDAE